MASGGSITFLAGSTFTVRAGSSMTIQAPVAIQSTATFTSGIVHNNPFLPFVLAHFDGAGTGAGTATINYSVNVTSITRINTGLYYVNLTTPAVNANYICVCNEENAGTRSAMCTHATTAGLVPKGANYFRLDVRENGGANVVSSAGVNVVCYGKPTALVGAGP
jgi:hypothetical protein